MAIINFVLHTKRMMEGMTEAVAFFQRNIESGTFCLFWIKLFIWKSTFFVKFCFTYFHVSKESSPNLASDFKRI